MQEFSARLHDELISLINTPASTNDPPTGSMHLGGIRTRVTTSHAESSDLTTILSLQKKEDFHTLSGEISTNIIYNTTEPNPTEKHTQDLRLFRCELSKVA